ncbi:MAG: phosphatidate cytidylyltransferase [Burkholderiaceae bacterium]|nr:phosphatidate cytidylyltransferase [Burkholderiaceae bacterium]
MRLGFSTQEAFFTILAVLILLSTIGTFVGSWLAKRATGNEVRTNSIRIVNSRVRSSWPLIIIFTIAFCVGEIALLFIFALMSFFALREFIALTPTRRQDHLILIIAFYIAIPLQYIFLGFDAIGLFTLFIPIYLFLTLPVVMALGKNMDRFLERVAKVQWGIMLTVFCISHAPAIATLNLQRYHSNGLLLMLYFLLVLYFADLFQIMASAIWQGRPTFSNPYKTYKGIFIGSFGALLMGSALFWLTPFRAWQAPLMSLVIIISGTLGGLVMTSIKRSLGAKRLDTSYMLTRGVLDKMEMLFFAAPVFYHCTVFFFMSDF